MSTASSSAHIDWSRMTDEEKFGLSIGQRLARLSERERRKLEWVIQRVVLDAERDALD